MKQIIEKGTKTLITLYKVFNNPTEVLDENHNNYLKYIQTQQFKQLILQSKCKNCQNQYE